MTIYEKLAIVREVAREAHSKRTTHPASVGRAARLAHTTAMTWDEIEKDLETYYAMQKIGQA